MTMVICIKSKIRFLLFIVSLSITINASAQSLPDSTIKKIDAIFSRWNTNDGPGVAIGIVRNDSIIYAKGYGMANLEHEIPITPETIFEMASIAKQFTAYAIILLARQEKLQLDDDIHKYLSWLPYPKEKITIRNLLIHTSGIRDFMAIGLITGVKRDDAITNESIIKILCEQQSLNFKPGEKFSYSNSNYILLAEVVKSVSGQSLRQFADSAIFNPLHMINTHFIDNYKEIIKNRSSSYKRIDSAHFENSIISYAAPGPTSLFTNIDDMAKWGINFYHPTAGDNKAIEQLTQKGKLNNGNETVYSSGIIVQTYKGWKEYIFNGGLASYRNELMIIPDLKMSFIAFSNDGDYYPHTDDMADLFINDTTKSNGTGNVQKRDSGEAILKDIISIQKIAGNYISDDGMLINFRLSNNKLYADAWGQSNLLWKDKADTFSYFNDPEVKFKFTINGKNSSVRGFFYRDPPVHYTKYVNIPIQTDALLLSYTGTFYCPELDAKYAIKLKDHHLVLANNRVGDTALVLVGNNHLISNLNSMNHLLVIRNNKNQVIGFEVNSDAIMHLRFNKIE